MRNVENEFYANRRFAIHLIRRSHGDGLGHQPQKIINVTPAWPMRTDPDINLEES